jgi:hypothetical protein
MNLSIVLRVMGDYEGANQAYLKALEIFKRSYGENHVKYTTNLSNLSKFFEK